MIEMYDWLPATPPEDDLRLLNSNETPSPFTNCIARSWSRVMNTRRRKEASNSSRGRPCKGSRCFVQDQSEQTAPNSKLLLSTILGTCGKRRDVINEEAN